MLLTALGGIPTITPAADLAAVILQAARLSQIGLRAGDVLVVAQKIVSKAEGRFVRLSEVAPSERATKLATQARKDPRLVELMLRESKEVLRCRPGVIIVEHRLGYVMANAGIDASNVEAAAGEETVLLLPENPDASAARLRERLREMSGVELGILIIDSFGRAWRLGTIGTAIGIAGLPGLLDLRGKPDRNGRPLQITEVAIADELASAASLLMGQASENRPVVHVRDFPYAQRAGSAAELIRDRAIDLFR